MAAILSSTEGCTSDTVCDEKGSAETGVATDNFRGVDGLLVRAHLPDNMSADMQESPVVGISCQTRH